jgi:hypothetical protein
LNSSLFRVTVSITEKDPEVIVDVDIAAQVVVRDLLLDEQIPRNVSGQGYVRVVELLFWVGRMFDMMPHIAFAPG